MNTSLTAADGAAPGARSPAGGLQGLQRLLARRPELFTLFLLVALCSFVAIANPAFLSAQTLIDIARASVVIGLFALGVFVILAAGGIDVSFTAIAALSMYSVTQLVVTHAPQAPLPLVFLAAALGGGLLGFVNGLLVHGLKAPSLIVTIGTQYLFRGVLLTFIGTVWITQLPDQMDSFGKIPLIAFESQRGTQVILPAYFLVLPAAALLTWWLLRRTLIA
ncbi:MAG: ABC transporter permease [Aquincola sp.]|nr:ABC transporter permease [Aquincola sp.]